MTFTERERSVWGRGAHMLKDIMPRNSEKKRK